MKGAQILFAVAAEEFNIAQGLRAFFFNGKAAVLVLDVVGGGDDIIGDLEKIPIVVTIWTLQEINYFGLVHGHVEIRYFRSASTDCLMILEPPVEAPG